MSSEKKTQANLVKYLKSKGCYVIKTRPGPGVPVGCPDVIAFHEGWWGGFEIKGAKNSKFQPLQKETIVKFEDWSTGMVVYPENYDDCISKLDLFFD